MMMIDIQRGQRQHTHDARILICVGFKRYTLLRYVVCSVGWIADHTLVCECASVPAKAQLVDH